MAKPQEVKTYIVEVEVIGRWIETYSVEATSEDEATSSWSEQGQYIESYNFDAEDFIPNDVYED